MARHSDLMAGIRMGDLAVSLIASGTPYSPDVADDLARRTLDLWNGTLDAMDSFEMLDNGGPHDDDDEDEKEAIVVIFPRNPRPMLPRFSPPRLPIRC